MFSDSEDLPYSLLCVICVFSTVIAKIIMTVHGAKPVDTTQINLDLFKSYVVEMNLQYTEYYAPLAGFGSFVTQTVIMDNSYQTRLISIYTSNPIS